MLAVGSGGHVGSKGGMLTGGGDACWPNAGSSAGAEEPLISKHTKALKQKITFVPHHLYLKPLAAKPHQIQVEPQDSRST